MHRAGLPGVTGSTTVAYYIRILEQRKLLRPANTFTGEDAIREKSIRVTQPESENVSFNEIWHTESERAWNQLLKKYWELIPVDNIQVEYRMNRLTRHDLEAMDEVQWYHFLHDEYFVWKYTAKNRLASTRLHLRKYREEQDLGRLDEIRRQIVQLDPDMIHVALRTACEIRGLGVAGASGLLSLVYPSMFATVDQFVVKALLEVPDHHDKVRRMNPESLTLEDGVVLTELLWEKASVLNEMFHSKFWTPRTVEMALWAYRPQ